jgi:hypothetical protein
MKSMTKKTFAIAILLPLSILIFTLCNKKDIFTNNNESKNDLQCNCQARELKANTTVLINNTYYSAYRDFNTKYPETFLVSKSEANNISELMENILMQNGITSLNYESPVALAVFYKDTINTLDNSKILGLLFYSQLNGKHIAQFWYKDQNKGLVYKPELSGFSSFVSKINFYQLGLGEKVLNN